MKVQIIPACIGTFRQGWYNWIAARAGVVSGIWCSSYRLVITGRRLLLSLRRCIMLLKPSRPLEVA